MPTIMANGIMPNGYSPSRIGETQAMLNKEECIVVCCVRFARTW